jgi:hypothetical protein
VDTRSTLPSVRAAIAAGPSTVSVGDVLDGGGICLARLPKGSLGEETSRLVGSLLVARTTLLPVPRPLRRFGVCSRFPDAFHGLHQIHTGSAPSVSHTTREP